MLPHGALLLSFFFFFPNLPRYTLNHRVIFQYNRGCHDHEPQHPPSHHLYPLALLFEQIGIFVREIIRSDLQHRVIPGPQRTRIGLSMS